MSTNETDTKREDYITWDDYFMAVAFLSAERSKDPSTQVGACIVNEHKRICGTGYNGMPDGCNDDEMAWGRGKKLKNKHLYVCHAEMNAIVNKNAVDVRGCTIYTGLFPCNECAKIIIQSGLKEVVYYSDKKKNYVKFQAARKLFATAGVSIREHMPKKPITIDFTKMDDKKPEKRKSSSRTFGEGPTRRNPSRSARSYRDPPYTRSRRGSVSSVVSSSSSTSPSSSPDEI